MTIVPRQPSYTAVIAAIREREEAAWEPLATYLQEMANPDRYKALLYSVLFKARQMGEHAPGSEAALACYQILEVATEEAEAYGIDLAELSLAGFDPADLLKAPPKKTAP